MKIKVYLTSLFTFLTLTASYSQNINGNLEGYIVDTSSVPVEGVNILLGGINLQGIRGTTTNENGYFRILNLPIGFYKVKISFIGYRNIIFENVQVSLDKTTNLGEIVLRLKVINIPEITISDRKPGIDPVSTTYGSNINSADFQNLPVDRNFGSIATLLPQTNVSYYNYDGANIGGATGFENKFYIDGVEVTDPVLGTSNVLTSVPK
ncbi:MAG: carboxypeptidase-like regulatory domain-containing protein, partial [Ignavibacteriaceae bacterium]